MHATHARRSALLLVLGLAACADEPALPRSRQPSTRPAQSTPDKSGGAQPTDTEDSSAAPDPKLGARIQIVDLGTVVSGQTVDLDVPPGAIGFNVTVTSDGDGTMGIETIATPTGKLVHEAFSTTNSVARDGEGREGVGSASVPQNDVPEALRPQPGAWKVTFGGAGTRAHARARIQTTSNGTFEGGALDLHLHFPKGLQIGTESTSHVVNARTAPTDQDVAARVDVFYSTLKGLFGIDRGNVSFHDTAAEFTVIGDDPTISRSIVTGTKGFPEEPVLHLILTNELMDNSFIGLSPGVPGAASLTGTSKSGVVAALFADVDANRDGWLWLHEFAHFVGLQHTSEEGGAEFDPLKDTPKCVGERAEPRSDQCGDANNLMIPGQLPGAPTVSKTQRAIFQAAPFYRPLSSGAPAAAAGGVKGATARSLSQFVALPQASVRHAGRALTRTERFISGSFCSQSRQSPDALVTSLGRARTIAELGDMSADAHLPSRYRTKALRMLERIH